MANYGYEITSPPRKNVTYFDNDNKIISYAFLGIVIAVFIWWGYFGLYKAGKDFWNKVKDLPEPIDLREIK